jgi:hypothetical protein
MSTPINLRAEFGHRWQIGLDEAAGGRWKDPWYFLIACQHGVIVPWGGDLLGASTHHGGSIARRLVKLPGVDVMHDGDDGATVVFHRRDLRAVAALLKPRQARRPNPAQLAALERGRLERQRRA